MNYSLDQLKKQSIDFIWKKLILLFIITMLVQVSNSAKASASAGVVNFQLSGDLPDFSFVYPFVLKPDGSRVVFRADRDIDEVQELYSVSINGGELTKLNPSFVTGRRVEDNFKISADGQWVVYLADQDIDDKFELYRVPIEGGESIKLNDTLADTEDVVGFEIADNSLSVVYMVVYPSAMADLYSIEIDGSNPTKLNAELGIGGKVKGWKIAPDSELVVYQVQQDASSHTELWSVHMDGLTHAELSDPSMIATGNVQSDFKITPNSLGVVFRADRYEDEKFELFSAWINGLARYKLNSNLVALGNVDSFLITPDSGDVVYRADQETNDKFELYSVSIFGGTTHPLTDAAMIAEGDVGGGYKITPDSQTVVYQADMFNDTVVELFSISILGTGLHRLHPTLTSGHSVKDSDITPNGLGAVFLAKLNDDDYDQLYSVYMNGTSLTQLTDINNSSNDVSLFEITPNSGAVVFWGELETDNMYELYTVSIFGGIILNCNVPIQNPNGDVLNFKISPDSKSIIYTTDNIVDENYELYRAFWGYKLDMPLVFH